MLKQILTIATEQHCPGFWNAELCLAGIGTVYVINAEGPTQCEAIGAACAQAREGLGKEFVPATGDNEADYQQWIESLTSIAELHGA